MHVLTPNGYPNHLHIQYIHILGNCQCVNSYTLAIMFYINFPASILEYFCDVLKNCFSPWLVWLSGLSAGLQTKGSLVQFPVRAHAWVVGQVPSGGHVRGNHTLMFLSLFFSHHSPLSKNK